MKNSILTATLIILSTAFSLSCAQSPAYKASLSPIEFSDKIKAVPTAPVIDVRTPAEFAEGHLLNAVNYDWNGDSFEQQVAALDKSKPVLVYCRSGSRSAAAAAYMRTAGFKEVYEMDGGFVSWRNANLPESNTR